MTLAHGKQASDFPLGVKRLREVQPGKRHANQEQPAFAIEKSAVSEKFVARSARKVNELLQRDLSPLRLCAPLLDGVEVKQQHLVTALGIDERGVKPFWDFIKAPARTKQRVTDCSLIWPAAGWFSSSWKGQQGRLDLAVTAKVVGIGKAAIPAGSLLLGEMAECGP
ncbi:MAG: hypothetical protein DMG26_00380 [Acidobacteria bacterium]|nr:MAG: hypothetical protein DMG26_00380 [Acidobacteriota bacterium]PYV26993.1 MAG: hypothetical protein DMG24_05810 [Acidobacteriota bacterium]